MAEDKHQIPGKYDLNAKWDACFDLTLRRFVYSSTAGAFAGLLLFRTPMTRWASVAFGAGVGLGRAYTECSYKFGSHSKWEGPSKDSHESFSSFTELTPMDQQTVNNDLED